MDCSYGNVFPADRALSPSTTSPTSDPYRINVSRQKTKKWANFKPQNYEGDDWGADYDEPEHEPEPPPPPKPMSPRHSPAQSPTARQPQTARLPPLHTQPQAYPAAAPVRPAQPGNGTGPDWKAAGKTASPPPNLPGAAGYARPVFSPTARHNPPPPQSASPSFSPFPPRKSSVGADAADSPDAPWRSSPSPRAAGSPKPWMEARSPSPKNAGPLASPANKPLPFVRPADVYRRMEEERQKERRSLESGRPAPENAVGRTGERPDSSAQVAPPQGAFPDRQARAAVVGGGGVPRGLKPTGGGLTPVDERKSEYGIEGLLASYGSEVPNAEPATAEGPTTSAEFQNSVDTQSPEKLRRFSTSPQLPDLTRMSGFGEHLFSSSNFFRSSTLRSPASGSAAPPMQDQAAAAASESVAAAKNAPAQSPTIAPESPASRPLPDTRSDSEREAPQHVSGANADTTAVPTPPNESVGSPSHQDKPSTAQHGVDAPEQRQPAADAQREVALVAKEQPVPAATGSAPPGGWDSVATTAPAEISTSPRAAPQEVPDETSESRGVLSPTEAVTQPTAASSDGEKPQPSQAQESGDTGDASAKIDIAPEQSTPQIQDRSSSPSKFESGEPTIVAPTSATSQHPEITPTAPLNPRRGSPGVSVDLPPVLAPPSFPAGSARGTPTDSPLKESDVLSEEIMKSLSPVQQPAGRLTKLEEGPAAAASRGPAGAARESNYLGDVYGDYWAAPTEDRPALPATGRAGESEKVALAPLSLPAAAAPEHEAVASVNTPGASTPRSAPEAQSATEAGPGALRRRFSWEAEQEGAVASDVPAAATEAPVEQKTLGSGLEHLAILAQMAIAPASEPPRAPTGSESERVASEVKAYSAESAPEPKQEATGAVSPQIPQTRTVRLPPSDGSGGSPSPISPKRLSLAEEKAEESGHPVSPSPPLEQHPAFAAEGQRLPEAVVVPPPGAPSPARKEAVVTMVPFRAIMEMPSAAERIRRYNETRSQISAVDTGLGEWLAAMLARYPEHANAGFPYVGSAAAAAAAAAAGGGGGAGHGGGPQSSHSQAAAAAGHMHSPSLHGLGGLGHSGAQMGTKSKELLMAAGKAGKGLLSKGRNKLRGRDGG